MPNPKPIFEYNLEFSENGKKKRVQQAARNLGDAENRVRLKHPTAGSFRMLKKMKYPHPIG